MPIVPTKDRPLNMPCDDPEGCKHFKAEMKFQERIKELEDAVKEWREKADTELHFNAKLHTETAHQAKRIKELEAKIDYAITAIQTGKGHTCPLCADYLNEAEQALKG